MTNIAVIGSSSFSGRSFIKFLSEKEETWNILGFSRSQIRNTPFDAFPENAGKFKNRVLDLDINFTEIVDDIASFEADYIVNFAAMSMVAESWKFPEKWYLTNVVSLSKLVHEINLKLPKLKKFIQFTTPEVYGTTNGTILENWNFNPSTPYAISRAAGDWHLRAQFENIGFPVVFTRAANVYGEYQRLYRIVPKTIYSILGNKKIPLHGGGSSYRSFIHIDDVSNGLKEIMLRGKIGDTYHISNQDFMTIFEVVKKICEIMEVNYENIIEQSVDRPGKDQAYTLDTKKIRQELNWKEEISFEKGIERTLNWINSRYHEFSESDLNYVLGERI